MHLLWLSVGMRFMNVKNNKNLGTAVKMNRFWRDFNICVFSVLNSILSPFCTPHHRQYSYVAYFSPRIISLIDLINLEHITETQN